MTKNEHIAALKELRSILNSKAFRELQPRRDCIARVVPLLKFDATYYANALQAGDILVQTGFSNNMYESMTARLDSMVGQAIAELETVPEKPPVVAAPKTENSQPQPSSTTLEKVQSPKLQYPEKVTLSWLSHHAPVSFWFWLIGIIVAVFLFGIKAGQIPALKQLFGP